MVPKVKPLCPVFGTCGGCAYQDIPYEEELALKEKGLKDLFRKELGGTEEIFEPILASPKPYHYRHRLDLSLVKTKQQESFIGFRNETNRRVVEVDSCAIAQEEVSKFIPELKKEAKQKLPTKYRMATLTVKGGEDGRIFWGGIGRRSLQQKEEDYLWTEIRGRKIFYSLSTFFQANLSILPNVIEKIRGLPIWNSQTTFFDLYAGVGLFGISLHDLVQKVVMIEDDIHSNTLAQFNKKIHHLESVEIHCGQMERVLPTLLGKALQRNNVALVDPPRKGLSEATIKTLVKATHLNRLLYLSCNPESLLRDLKIFLQNNWKLVRIFPFDFFPKTKHLETLVWLEPRVRLFLV